MLKTSSVLCLSVNKVTTDEELEEMLHRDNLAIFISDVSVLFHTINSYATISTIFHNYWSLTYAVKLKLVIVKTTFPFTDQLWKPDFKPSTDWNWMPSSRHHVPWVEHQRASWDICGHCHAVGDSGKAFTLFVKYLLRTVLKEYS